MKYGILIAAAALAAGCVSNAPAPVIERAVTSGETVASRAASPVPVGGEFYTVKKGDTLYSIALEHGRDYREIAAWNNVDNPNRIQVGQQLRVAPAAGEEPVAVARPVTSSAPVKAEAVRNTDAFKREPKGGKVAYSDEALARMREQSAAKVEEKPAPATEPAPVAEQKAPPPAGDDAVDWAWPARGKPTAGFSESGSVNKGIDIGGSVGDPVFAAAEGKVVYVGNGLRGYGNLVIVRHNGSYLSAYAHNSKILVKETQAVAKGQKIAEIGSSDAAQAGLHFEIRRLGKPVDPLNYLPAR